MQPWMAQGTQYCTLQANEQAAQVAASEGNHMANAAQEPQTGEAAEPSTAVQPAGASVKTSSRARVMTPAAVQSVEQAVPQLQPNKGRGAAAKQVCCIDCMHLQSST